MITREDKLNGIYFKYSQDHRFDALRTSSPSINLVPGVGPMNATVMLIGEKPGRQENTKREPFVGRAGKNLEKLMEDTGISLEQTFRTNLVKYWPFDPRNPKKARVLTNEELTASVDYAQQEISTVDPLVVGLMGRDVLKAFYPEYDQTYSVHGQLLDDIFVPLYHPAVVLYRPDKWNNVKSGFEKLVEHVKAKSNG